MGNTIWRPDTCDCVIEYSNTESDEDGDPKFIRIVESCQEHGHMGDNGQYKSILAHNRAFNLKHGRDPTEEQIDEIISDKKAEKVRIREL